MSLDYFPGQNVTLIERLGPEDEIVLWMMDAVIPVLGVVYAIVDTKACESCGAPHITLKQCKADDYYPGVWFRPVESTTMQTLRGLLSPDGGSDEKPKQLDEVPA